MSSWRRPGRKGALNPAALACLFGQVAHGLLQSAYRHTVHAILHDVLDDGDGLPVGPVTFGLGIEPCRARPVFEQTLQPGCPGFGIVVLDRAAWVKDLV